MKISKLIEVLAQYLQEQKDMDILVEKYEGLPFSSVLTDAEVKEAMESLKNEGG